MYLLDLITKLSIIMSKDVQEVTNIEYLLIFPLKYLVIFTHV